MEKDDGSFYLRNKKNGILRSACKECFIKDNTVYRKNNKDNIAEYDKVYYQNNKDKKQELRKNNKDKRNNNAKHRRKHDPMFRIRQNISNMINVMLMKSNKTKNQKSILDLLPYTISRLKEHLESQFEPWMNWGNQGKYDPKTWRDNDQSTWTWQLDHIIPHYMLPYTLMSDDNFLQCWALSNLRPLSAKQNVIENRRGKVK
jgi:hypothetical protein